jgi:hypothetical protein
MRVRRETYWSPMFGYVTSTHILEGIHKGKRVISVVFLASNVYADWVEINGFNRRSTNPQDVSPALFGRE